MAQNQKSIITTSDEVAKRAVNRISAMFFDAHDIEARTRAAGVAVRMAAGWAGCGGRWELARPYAGRGRMFDAYSNTSSVDAAAAWNLLLEGCISKQQYIAACEKLGINAEKLEALARS